MADFTLPEFPTLSIMGAKILLNAMDEVRATRAEILGTQ